MTVSCPPTSHLLRPSSQTRNREGYVSVGAPFLLATGTHCKVYYEVEVLEAVGYVVVGFAGSNFASNPQPECTGVGDDKLSWGCCSGMCERVHWCVASPDRSDVLRACTAAWHAQAAVESDSAAVAFGSNCVFNPTRCEHARTSCHRIWFGQNRLP